MIKNKSIVIKKKPGVKLVFQVCFSPHEKIALAILLIKTHITIIRIQTIGPDLLELGSAGSPAEFTHDWEQQADGYTCMHYTTPQLPDSDNIHYHTPITSLKQEKWHRSHEVILDRYHRSLINQVQIWFVLTEMHFADLLDWRILPTTFLHSTA